jgi:N-methylhydantoinase A
MVAGGAAAGLHAVPMARELGMKQVLVPSVAGVLSAFGILVSDIKSGFSRSFTTTSDAFDFAGVERTMAALEAQAAEFLERMDVPMDRREIRFSVEARYRGQVWQLSVPLTGTRVADAAALGALLEAFHRLHERFYFVRSADRVEFTEWNVLAIGRLPRTRPEHRVAATAVGSAGKAARRVYARELGGEVEVPVLDGAKLAPGAVVEGPAIIDQPLTSIVLYPDATARMSANSGIWIDLH